MKKVMLYLILIVMGLSFVLGAMMLGKLSALTPAGQERQRIENAARADFLARARAVRVAWEWAWRVVAVVGAVGLLGVGLRWLDRRAAEVRPDSAGLYPVIRVKVGQVMALHDPNRAVSAVTLYTPAQLLDQVTVVTVPTGGDDLAQERTTARAQAVQLAVATHQHPPTLASGSGQGSAALPSSLEEVQEHQSSVWPARVPLSGLLNGQGASLHRLVLGVHVDENGHSEVITGDMARLVHVAIGGSSGWGKSMFVRALTYQLATCPERPSLALVDLEAVTFAPFARCDRLLYPVADTEQDALAVFRALTGELDRRKALFAGHPGIDSLARYNQAVSEQLTPIIALVDEATALLSDKSVETALRTLALRGRKFGLWLCLCGQDWKSSSLDTAIRNQLSARVQFKAMSASQSRVLLQQKGAEDLDVCGRALAVLPGRGLLQFQAPMIGHDDIIAALAGQGPQHPLPMVQDDAADELSADQVRIILALAEQGKSPSAIAETVFGYRNARRVEQVRSVIEQCDT